MTRVEDVVGAYVAWPISLIEPIPQGTEALGKKAQVASVKGTGGPAAQLKKKSSRAGPVSQATKAKGKKKVQVPAPVIQDTSAETPNRARLRAFAATVSRDATVTIPFNRLIFGESNFNELLSRDQVMEVLDERWVGATVVNLWIRHLHEEVIVSEDNVSFEFINPYLITQIEGVKRDDQFKEIKRRFTLKATGRTLFLAPINTGVHWVLLVINPTVQPDPLIYYLDPVESAEPDNRPDLMRVFNGALTSYRAANGYNYSKAHDQKDAYPWLKVQCPHQPNDNDCGYYVMYYMRDIVSRDRDNIPLTYYPDTRCFMLSREKMKALIEEWCSYVHPLFSQIGQPD